MPKQFRYSLSHYWLCEVQPRTWRIGITKFATRMLGDLVEHEFTVRPDSTIHVGDTIGWIEGFKAVSDLFAVADGEFIGANADLFADSTLLDKDLYDQGWLYQIKGQPDERSLDVNGYVQHLDVCIDRILAQEQAKGEPEC